MPRRRRPPRRRPHRPGGGPAPRRPSSGAACPRRRADPDAQQRPAVQQQRRAVTAGGARFGAGRGDHQGRAGIDRGHHRFARGGDHRRAGKRAAELFGGPAGAHHDGAHRVRSACAAAQRRHRPGRTIGTPAPSPSGLQRQRAGAMPATRDRPATRTGQRRDVAAPRHLNQHGRLGLQAVRAARSATDGSRAVRAAGSRSSA